MWSLRFCLSLISGFFSPFLRPGHPLLWVVWEIHFLFGGLSFGNSKRRPFLSAVRGPSSLSSPSSSSFPNERVLFPPLFWKSFSVLVFFEYISFEKKPLSRFSVFFRSGFFHSPFFELVLMRNLSSTSSFFCILPYIRLGKNPRAVK